MTNFTDKQIAVLKAFPGYKNPMDTKTDLGSSWTDANELANVTGLTVKQVQGVLGNLVKKDLVYTDVGGDNNPIQCLSEVGCDALAEILAAPVEEAPAYEEVADRDYNAKLALDAYKANAKARVEEAAPEADAAPVMEAGFKPTKAVWAIADSMPAAARKDVVAACVAAGINPATARTQYQKWFTANKAG